MSTSNDPQTVSFRLDPELAEKLSKFVALSNFNGNRVSTSDVIREALESYLTGAYEKLAELVKEELGAAQQASAVDTTPLTQVPDVEVKKRSRDRRKKPTGAKALAAQDC